MSEQILIINDKEAKSLPKAILLGELTRGLEPTFLESAATGLEHLMDTTAKHRYSMMVSNRADHELFQAMRTVLPKAKTILVTDQTMENYVQALHNEEGKLIDHLVANGCDGNWPIDDLRITIHKLKTNDHFGIEKYLKPSTIIHRKTITGSEDRLDCNRDVMNFIANGQFGQSLAKVGFGITEELVMNAIYDAPAAAGKVSYDSAEQRRAKVDLPDSDYATLSYGSDGERLVIGTEDPFGALDKCVLDKYVKKITNRTNTASIIDTKKGGAGLGFFKILYNSHGLICNVAPGKRTEIISVIEIWERLRDFHKLPRSIHFFQQS